MLVPTLNYTIWANAGTANLATLHNTDPTYFTPTSGTAGVLTQSPLATQWNRINLAGQADYLYLCYRSKIIDVGGLTDVPTGGAWGLPAVGSMYRSNDADFDIVAAVTKNPLFSSGAAVADELVKGDMLTVKVWEPRTTGSVVSGADRSDMTAGGLFLQSDGPTNDTYYSWTAQFGKVLTSATQGAAGVGPTEYKVSGLQTAWIAPIVTNILTGTVLTTKLKAELRILAFKEVMETGAGSHTGLPFISPAAM